MSKILGLNAFHADAAACLIIDGELISAAEEERFLRIKHWAGFPSESIKFCLSNSGLSLSDIDYVAINSDPTKNFSWEYILIDRKNVRNARCMPGGKIAVYTGILEATKNTDGLAASWTLSYSW